ncbi:MAG: DUF4149 domain-containing protein [Verrucomicrobiales bacterium]
MNQEPGMKVLGVWRFALGLWAGAQMYFAFAVAMPLFRILPRAEAGDVVTALFPIFYGVNYALAILAGVLLLTMSGRIRGRRTAGLAVFLAVGFVATNHFVLGPQLDALRAAGDMQGFGRLHSVSLGSSLISLICVLSAAILPRPQRG